MKKKTESLKIAYSDDNFIARIIIQRDNKNSKIMSPNSIFNKLVQKKFKFEISKKKIEQQIWQFIKSDKLENKITVFSDPLMLLSQYVKVSISGDEMRAAITLNIPERFQNLISVLLLYRLLKNAKVQAGIQEDKVEEVIAKLKETPGQIQNFPIAFGQAEIFGSDGQIKLSDQFKNKIILDKKRKNGISNPMPAESTDYSVKKDDVLVTVYPGQKGKEGFKINGMKLWSSENTKLFKTPTVTISRNIREIIHNNRIEYHSTTDGKAFFINNKIIDVEEAFDSKFSIEVTKDKLESIIILQGPKGGKKFSFTNVQKAIENSGIKTNLDLVDLKVEIDTLNEINNMKVKKINMAKGTAPIHGQDEKIYWDINIDNLFIPVVNSRGDIDYKNSNSLPFIRKDQKAGILYPVTKGEKNGLDVYGEEIPALDGKKFNIEISDLFEFLDGSENNRKCQYLIAKTAGLVIKKKNEIKIIPVFETKEIGISTGNINFDGVVLVNGTIQDGFSVKATKEIIIKGSIGACHVESKSNIQIKGGINGRSKGKIISKKDVIVKYAENCTIIAGNRITIDKHILLSTIISYGDVFIGKQRKNGKVIGSRIWALKGIYTNYVGANTSIDSCLWTGINHTKYRELLKIEKSLEIINTKLSSFQFQMLDRKKMTDSQIKELKKQRDFVLIEQSTLMDKKNELHQKAFSTENIEIEIINNIQAHTMIKMAEIEYPLAAPKSRLKFLLKKGQIIQEDIKK